MNDRLATILGALNNVSPNSRLAVRRVTFSVHKRGGNQGIPVLRKTAAGRKLTLKTCNCYMPVNILIADDDAPIRRLLRRVIEEHENWQVCGEAENGREVLAKIGESSPDLVVMDLAMPQMNGLQAAREICKVSPHLPMLLLTVQQVSKELVQEARSAGFHGAVSKSTGSEVVRGIETLLRNEDFFKSSPTEASAFGA
jgi:CheY-like chemotaxis protein